MFKIRITVNSLCLCLLTYTVNAQNLYTNEYNFSPFKGIGTGRLAAQSVVDAGGGHSVAVYNVTDANGQAIYITEIDGNGNYLCATPIEQFQNTLDIFANSITNAAPNRYLVIGRWGNASTYGLFIARVSSVGAVFAADVFQLPASPGYTNIEGINIIRANTGINDFIATAVVKHNGSDKLLVLKFNSTDFGTTMVWNSLYTYAPMFPDGSTTDVLPTSIVAVEGGYVIVGRHIFKRIDDFPGRNEEYSVFALKVDESGVVQGGNFNTYNMSYKYGDEYAHRPGIQHLPETGDNVLVFGSPVPDPFPQHPGPPLATATSIAASIVIDVNFNVFSGYLYWASDGIQMGFHSIYDIPETSSPDRSSVMGYMLMDNGRYTPVFSVINSVDGWLAHYLTRYWVDKNIFSPFTMSDFVSTNRHQYIGSEKQGKSSGKLNLIRTSKWGDGLCAEDVDFAFKKVSPIKTIYSYYGVSIEMLGLNPEINPPVSYLLQENSCSQGVDDGSSSSE